MKQLFSWRTLALVLLVVVSVGGAITFSAPSTATSSNYQQMIELGIIDEVIDPEDVGLDYLHQRPPQLIARLMDNIKEAREVYQSTDNINLAIPLGEPGPVRVGELQSDNGIIPVTRNLDLEAIGSLSERGAEEITRADAIEMVTVEERQNGTLDILAGSLDNRETLVADASNLLVQRRIVRSFDLIARDRRTNRIYLLPEVRADSFCRSVINAGIKRRFRRNRINLRNVRLRRL